MDRLFISFIYFALEGFTVIKQQKPAITIISPPSFDPEVYNRLVTGTFYFTVFYEIFRLADPAKRLFGGKMTDARLNKVHEVTDDVISSMHRLSNFHNLYVYLEQTFYLELLPNLQRMWLPTVSF